MKKTLMFVTPLILGLPFIGNAASSVDINFKGTVVDGLCSVSLDSQNQEVNFGEILVSRLRDEPSKAIPFSVVLEYCSEGNVLIDFIGQSVQGDADKGAYLAVQGDASGIGINIQRPDGSWLDPHGSVASFGIYTAPLAQGRNTFTFSARVAQLYKNTPATPGDFYSSVTLNLYYP